MLLHYSIAHNAIILTIWSNGIYGKFFRYHLFFITIAHSASDVKRILFVSVVHIIYWKFLRDN